MNREIDSEINWEIHRDKSRNIDQELNREIPRTIFLRDINRGHEQGNK